MRQVFLSSLAYFGLVFAAGFVLGTLRVLLIVPLIGERYAELMEMPVMLAVSWFAASFILNRFRISGMLNASLIGLLALALLIVMELTVVLQLRGMSVQQYIASRDPVAFTAYVIGLLAFAAMPPARGFLRGGFAGKESGKD